MTFDLPAPTSPDDTQPIPVVRDLQTPRTRNGCRSNLLLIVAGLVLVPTFLCGLVLLLYVMFPPVPIDILVLGVDGREAEGFVSRTDSIMLVGVNPSQLRVSMLSIPRDLFIDVSGYGLQRVNTVNMLGEQEAAGHGPQLLSESIAQSFGVQTDRYIRLDFGGFVDLIDAVGGVTVYVERVIVDDSYPTPDGGVTTVRFDSGWQYMDGERALIYARTRHSSDDYQRAERQQQILSALSGKLVNPANWPAIAVVINRSVDTDLSLWDMVVAAPPVILNAGRFEQLVIDREYISGAGEGQAIPNYELIAPWLEGRFD